MLDPVTAGVAEAPVDDAVAAVPKPAFLDRLKTLIREYVQIQSEGTMDTLRRYRLLVMVAVPLHFGLGIFFGQFKAPEGRLDIQAWADALTLWQLGLATVLFIIGVSVHFYLKRRTIANWLGTTLQAAFCIAYLTFGAAGSYLDLRIGNGIGTFLIICLGIGTISLMSPMMSIAIFGSTAVVFSTILHRSSIDPTLLASIKVQVVAMLVMAVALSAVLWHQYTRTVLLRRQLSDSNAILQAQQLELVTLAERDPLTGLYNRRQFMRMAEMELVRADRMPRGTSLLMVDLDFFKKVNDQHGHPAGDGVLQQVAGILMGSVRASDLVGRMGGEEFIVLLPYTTPDQAMVVAEKLRLALRAHPLKIERLELPVTASFGVTGITETQKAPLQALYTAADLALYTAKHAGRDRVALNPPEHTPRPTFS
jgi:diguanylate cyclase (GGDEF)-like protein